jgi:hypothetical protein
MAAARLVAGLDPDSSRMNSRSRRELIPNLQPANNLKYLRIYNLGLIQVQPHTGILLFMDIDYPIL